MNVNNIINDYEIAIRKRINKRIPLNFIQSNICSDFYVAGNSLNKEAPNDIDIFPIDKKPFEICSWKSSNFSDSIKVICKTKNAITTKICQNDVFYTVQFCNYFHESLKDLVESFDFSHVQVGAEIRRNNLTYPVYFSEKYILSKMIQSTEYVGSEYPLSSLVRMAKYIKRGDFAGKSYIFSMFKILNDIIERGFFNYQDFKDQLDAVDLGLLPEDFQEMNKDDMLMKLFKNLSHKV